MTFLRKKAHRYKTGKMFYLTLEITFTHAQGTEYVGIHNESANFLTLLRLI